MKPMNSSRRRTTWPTGLWRSTRSLGVFTVDEWGARAAHDRLPCAACGELPQSLDRGKPLRRTRLVALRCGRSPRRAYHRPRYHGRDRRREGLTHRLTQKSRRGMDQTISLCGFLFRASTTFFSTTPRDQEEHRRIYRVSNQIQRGGVKPNTRRFKPNTSRHA
jgi:hypothetical protein